MAHRPDESDHRDDLDDWESPSGRDTAQSEGHSIDLAQCPYCGKVCAAIADVCPHCHSFVHVAVARHYPWWIWVGLAGAAGGAATWIIPF